MISVRISSQDLDHLIVLRLLSLETNDLLLSSDRGCISLIVLLDLSAAFDTIGHNILLNRLENFVGISGRALAWFKSYLSDLYQFVAVNDKVSYRSQVRMEYLKAQYKCRYFSRFTCYPWEMSSGKMGLAFTVMLMILSSIFYVLYFFTAW